MKKIRNDSNPTLGKTNAKKIERTRVRGKNCEIKMVAGNWVKGKYGATLFEAKIYITPSDFGIEKGRVSKLHITLKTDLVSFDRGWEFGKENETVWRPVVQALETFAQTPAFAAALL